VCLFASSDDLVDLIWQSSVRTAGDMVSPAVDLDPRGCAIELPEVLLDGTDRDRCPWVGDEAVLDVTLLVSRGDLPVMPAMLEWFASAQRPDGSIPSSPFRGKVADLIDYNAYWVEALYQYTLYSGNLAPRQTRLPEPPTSDRRALPPSRRQRRRSTRQLARCRRLRVHPT
jgi:hypothetical protein